MAEINTKWAIRFLELAELVAGWSKDPSTGVGAVLVDDRRRVVGIGYNGFPDRVPDNPEWLNDRETKLRLTIHAEMNAILNCAVPTQGLHLFVTHPPCGEDALNCAKMVVQAGITSVTCWEPDEAFTARWGDQHETILNAAGMFLRKIQRRAHDESNGSDQAQA